MPGVESSYLVRRVPDEASDGIPLLLEQLRGEGHFVTNVQREGEDWAIYARERRFRVLEPGSLITYRRRSTD